MQGRLLGPGLCTRSGELGRHSDRKIRQTCKSLHAIRLWFGEETAGLKRYVPAEIILAVWHVEALTPQALAELHELIALSIKAGAWPVTLDEQFWQHLATTPDSVSADPLRSLRATNTTSIEEAVSLVKETHEEEHQAAQELAAAEEES